MAKKVKKKPEAAAPKKQAKPAHKPQKEQKEDFRGIVRIAGKDVKGEVRLVRALSRVRGIGQTLAVAASRAIKNELSIDPDGQVGDLSEEQIEKIDAVLHNLQSYDVPKFLLNRRGDFNSGKDRHVIMNDLIFEVTQDVDREKKMYSWRGYRHTYGQKVRGQKTRNTGRTGMAVGVLRKAIVAAQGGAAAGAKPAAGAPAKPAAEKK
ncbi:MAG: 30S ribosomal protein S13 [Candidatus Micrarchaeota archaeon]